ncbi:hypothetical protein [Flagellimonas allohymeniacidonis]|uniref:Outer membrane insertion C-signal n=1 Tax=Flagellimonas allohymeniacidonis TaxID=2517819 RepID=A0A4Q8QEQ2_9FLAO|nr:hypothetical protein [Allomuricauda hymeniacidonis]TAI48284.1 hypothetical protein EW142_00275 [Allomuricauda hymeniacidonis]
MKQMKKSLLCLFAIVAFSATSYAQTSYTGAVGLGIDLWDSATFVGPSGKYFFSDNHVGQFDLGFEDGGTILTALYSYHDEFTGAAGLRWYAGIGPSIVLIEDFDNVFALRPHAGLDFKIDGVPIVINFDWRPAIVISDAGDNEAGAFGFGIQYAFN